jgi:hypothetical protein
VRECLPPGWRRCFGADVEIVARLNDAQRRLRDANERLWSGLAPDAFGCVDGAVAAAGGSQIARLMGDAVSGGGRGSQAAVLEALAEIHYQFACEERRQLAVDVGELSWQLTEVLCAAGWSADAARDADVHELATAGAR